MASRGKKITAVQTLPPVRAKMNRHRDSRLLGATLVTLQLGHVNMAVTEPLGLSSRNKRTSLIFCALLSGFNVCAQQRQQHRVYVVISYTAVYEKLLRLVYELFTSFSTTIIRQYLCINCLAASWQFTRAIYIQWMSVNSGDKC
jgi:hypothetical protein